MKNRSFSYFSLVIVMTVSACAPATMNQMLADGQKPLNKEQLQSLIDNHDLHLEAIDLDATIQYLTNGKLTAKNLKGAKDTGKWSIIAENQLCMKFDRWYYSDLKCYTFFPEKDRFVLFTSNGARYSTATPLAGTHRLAAGNLAIDDSPTAFPGGSDIPTPLRSSLEKEHSLISLAKNCPDCNFAGANLAGAQLITANLSGADLSGSNLRGANLRRANLARANLSGANLTLANMAGADLSDSDLRGADLTGSNLIRANVTGAQLDGAVLLGAHLESIQGLTK